MFKKSIPLYLLVGLIALGLRLVFNFSQELIPGVNGGYYPLQVRSVLLNGHLGFSDMPLLFYLDAFFIKVITFFGIPMTDALIMNVVKMVDSISIPLILIPLYKIVHLEGSKTSKIFETGIPCFAVLSFSPLILTSDLQKNALAIVFLFFFIAYLQLYLKTKRKSTIIISAAFLFLTGLTHFGTFIIGIIFLGLATGYVYRRKALIPFFLVVATGLFVVFLFDASRFFRLMSSGALLFEKPALIHGMLNLPDILIFLVSIVLAIAGVAVLRTKGDKLMMHQKAILFSCVVCLLSLSFPLLDGEYFNRLSLFLFIPQTLLMVQVASVISIRRQKKKGVVLFVITLLSVVAVFGHPKEPVIDKNAYDDLKKLSAVVRPDKGTIIIARHGLEWWTAWALHTRVGQDKTIDQALFSTYSNVIFLNQVNGLRRDGHRQSFREPLVPRNSEMIFSSEYFRAYQVRIPDTTPKL